MKKSFAVRFSSWLSVFKQNSFVGYFYYLLSTIVLGLEFFSFIFPNLGSVKMDFWNWVFYFSSSFSHAAIVMLVPLIVMYFLPLLLHTKKNLALGLMSSIAIIIEIVVIIDRFVFSFYRFHINGIVLDMLFGEGGSEIFVFDMRLILKAIFIFLCIVGINIILIKLSLKSDKIHSKKKWTVWGIVVILFLVIFANVFHAYSRAVMRTNVLKSATFIPYYYPVTANTLFDKLGIYSKEQFYNNKIKESISSVNYPKNPIQDNIRNDENLPNIIFIVIDSWNRRAFDAQTMPHTYAFTHKSEWFSNHFSSSNGTRGGIFGMMYSLPSTYWSDFELGDIHPIFIDEILKHGYVCQAYPSATLLSPPFAKTVFGKIKNLNTHTEGKSPYIRDCNLTKNFISNLGKWDGKQPMFSFLFYDLAHAISLPKNLITHFSPCWKYVDYTKLSNSFDATPYFNLYRECLYQVDSLIGMVFSAIEKKGMMDNTIIIVVGDHSQEFNENHKNYWGHNGNFSAAQIATPLLYYYPLCKSKKYTHRTTHYDIVPTLMNKVFKPKNPISDYSFGMDLHNTSSRLPHIVGSDIDFAFIIENDVIIRKAPNGSMEVYDKNMNPLNIHPPAKQVSNAIKKMNSFYK